MKGKASKGNRNSKSKGQDDEVILLPCDEVVLVDVCLSVLKSQGENYKSYLERPNMGIIAQASEELERRGYKFECGKQEANLTVLRTLTRDKRFSAKLFQERERAVELVTRE